MRVSVALTYLECTDRPEKQPVVLRRYTIAELNPDQSQRLGKEIK